jgi:DNA (cytosine-5)-methyltransferase 1
MKVLDLFCGAGGAAIGYWKAGFEVVGVDIEPQPRYPFEFIQSDAMTYPLDGYDLIHASPPCQAYSSMKTMNPSDAPELIKPLRERLRNYEYVIENVIGAPLMGVMLCGTSFGLRMQRHRLFETSFDLPSLSCAHDDSVIYINPYKTKGRKKAEEAYGDTVWRLFKKELGLEFMTDYQASQAVPPQYTKYIGEYFRGINN